MKKDKAFYLSLGMDEKTAEYFANGRRKIVSVAPNDDYTLTLSFDNGEQRIYDVKPLLNKGSVFEVIANPEAFKRVYLDDSGCVAWDKDPNVDSKEVWDNKLDLCPDSCYINSVSITKEKTA